MLVCDSAWRRLRRRVRNGGLTERGPTLLAGSHIEEHCHFDRPLDSSRTGRSVLPEADRMPDAFPTAHAGGVLGVKTAANEPRPLHISFRRFLRQPFVTWRDLGLGFRPAFKARFGRVVCNALPCAADTASEGEDGRIARTLEDLCSILSRCELFAVPTCPRAARWANFGDARYDPAQPHARQALSMDRC